MLATNEQAAAASSNVVAINVAGKARDALDKTERAKYADVWSIPEYATFSPGEYVFPRFKRMARPKNKASKSILDIGTGSGKGARAMIRAGWSDITLMDFASNGRIEEVKHLPYIDQNIWEPWNVDRTFDYGYCCDVMEHLPPEMVDLSISNIVSACDKTFFSICFGPDHFGKVIGHPLHLTVKPFTWWRDKLRTFGKLQEAIDMLGMGVFYVTSR